MRIEGIVGQRIREARGSQTQEQLGQGLSAMLGRPWSRQAVSAAEKGDRAFTAVELVGIAATLGVSVAALLMPPAGVDVIELPSGSAVLRDDLVGIVLPRLGNERTLAEGSTLARLAELARTIEGIKQRAGAAAEDVQVINDFLLMAAREWPPPGSDG